MLAINKRWPWLHIFEQVRMVAHLLQLHQHIEKSDLLRRSRLIGVNNIDVTREYVLVELLLDLAHPNKEVDFLFRQQRCLYI